MALFKKNYSTKTDEELMALISNGIQSAFEELYRRYSTQMLNFFFRMLNYNREKSEDMLHDLFMKIIEKPESFDRSRKFSSWFYTLAGNLIKNEYRSRQVRSHHEESVKLETATFFNEFVGNELDKQLFYQKLQKELHKLDADAQILFNLRFTEEMSIKQIAEVIECPEGTVKSRLFYLTKQLSQKLAIYRPELN